jgi:hypothetical protein
MAGEPEKNETSLSELLRAMYLHDLELCILMASDNEMPVFTKDQIVSVLEKGAGEKSAWELKNLCSFHYTLEALVGKKALDDRTKVFVMKEEGPGIFLVSSLLGEVKKAGRPELKDAPPWWDAPVPFVSWKKGCLFPNRAAAELLGGAEVKKGGGEEFMRELGDGRCLLFRKIYPAVFFVEDVSEVLGKAREMAWWAAVGRAFAGSMEEKGCRVERVAEPAPGRAEETAEYLKCLWDGEELGYLKVNHEKKPG